MDLHFKSAAEIARLIRERKVGAVEALEHFLARVEKYNARLNAIIWLDAARARERARAADAALAKGEIWGPLHGVPMTIKESYNVAGSPTTFGSVRDIRACQRRWQLSPKDILISDFDEEE